MEPQELWLIRPGDILHDGSVCARTVGPRGGVKETVFRVKVTSVKTWTRQPDRIEVRWQHGLRRFGVITPDDAWHWHHETDCWMEA